jgi:hypothetical protein
LVTDVYAPQTSFPILRFFEYEHLKPELQIVSKPFRQLAWTMVDRFYGKQANYAEIAVGLRKLLEAKDCMVRAEVSRSEPAVDSTGQATAPNKP